MNSGTQWAIHSQAEAELSCDGVGGYWGEDGWTSPDGADLYCETEKEHYSRGGIPMLHGHLDARWVEVGPDGSCT